MWKKVHFDRTMHLWSPLRKFQIMLILSFEANSALSCQNGLFLCFSSLYIVVVILRDLVWNRIFVLLNIIVLTFLVLNKTYNAITKMTVAINPYIARTITATVLPWQSSMLEKWLSSCINKTECFVSDIQHFLNG